MKNNLEIIQVDIETIKVELKNIEMIIAEGAKKKEKKWYNKLLMATK